MTEQTKAPEAQQMELIRVKRATREIYGRGDEGSDALLFTILKKAAGSRADDTNAGTGVGQKPHLMDKLTARDLRDFNSTHAISLDAKNSSSVGLGHRNQEIHEKLDPLCRFEWQDVLDAAGEDYWETGDGFIEVAWDEDRTEIVYLGHLESAQVHIEQEQEGNSELYHYVVQGETGAAETTIMAKFGDLIDLKRRHGQAEAGGDDAPSEADDPGFREANEAQTFRSQSSATGGTIVDSEVIHFRQPTNKSRYYGYPDYMSAVPAIELVQCMSQHEFDFYFNRGVPEFMLFLLGRSIGKSMDQLKELIQDNQGLGNSRKTGVVHIPGDPQSTTVQLEKLAMEESKESGFADKAAALAGQIATAHGMPPLLANLLISGKMGANNEALNAMLIFQKRKLGQTQKRWSRMLACTLGLPESRLSQPDGTSVNLAADQFLGKGIPEVKDSPTGGMVDDNNMPIFHQPGNGFNTILDGMTLGAMQTMSTMREELTGSGRNPADGTLSGTDDRQEGDPRQTR